MNPPNWDPWGPDFEVTGSSGSPEGCGSGRRIGRTAPLHDSAKHNSRLAGQFGRFKVVLAWLSKQSRRGMLDKLPMDILTSRDGYRYRLTVLGTLACACHTLRCATLAERTMRTNVVRRRCDERVIRYLARYISYKLQGVSHVWQALHVSVNHYLATGLIFPCFHHVLLVTEEMQFRGTLHVHALIDTHPIATDAYHNAPDID